jgi:hypothetical protein
MKRQEKSVYARSFGRAPSLHYALVILKILVEKGAYFISLVEPLLFLG